MTRLAEMKRRPGLLSTTPAIFMFRITHLMRPMRMNSSFSFTKFPVMAARDTSQTYGYSAQILRQMPSRLTQPETLTLQGWQTTHRHRPDRRQSLQLMQFSQPMQAGLM